MVIPVFKSVNGEEIPHFLNISEILVVAVELGRIVYKTKEQTYLAPETLEDQHRLLASFGFERTDRSCLAKLREVKFFHEDNRKLYFEDENEINPASVYAEISESNFKKVRKLPIKRKKRMLFIKKPSSLNLESKSWFDAKWQIKHQIET